jgi:molecular chaperone IbpA
MSNFPRRIDTANLPDFVRSVANRAIGFDSMLDDYFFVSEQQTNYPPYNLVRTNSNAYEIMMAVAGFSKDEVNVQVVDRELLITGVKTSLREEEPEEVIHQGLAMRDFKRSFKLAEFIEVKGAKMEDGLLTVQLERIIPDAAKPKLIQIK